MFFVKAVLQRPNEVAKSAKSPSLYIEHTKSYDKTILTRTFL